MSEASSKRSIGLKFKFFSVVFIFVIICILIGAVGLWNLSEMKNQIKNIVDNSAEKIMLATATKNDLLVIAVSEKNMLISEKESEMTAYADIIAKAESAIKEQTQAMIPLAGQSEKKLLEDFNQAFASFMTVNAQITELTLQNTNFKAARLSATEGMPLIKELDQHVENILQQYETEFDEATKLFDAMYLAQVGELMQRSARLLGMVKALQTTGQAIILSRDPQEIETLVQQLSELTTTIQAEFDDLESEINDKSRSDFNAAKDLFASFTKTIGQITQLALQNSNEKAFTLSMTEGKKYLDQAEGLMTQVVEHSRQGLKADRETSDKNFRQALSVLAGIAAAGILAGIILASIIISQLMTVLNKSFSFAKTLSSGDFTSRLDIRRNDELGDLARHLNDIALNVGELIKGLLQKIESLTQASKQLASLSGGMTSHASDASTKSRSAAQAAKDMDDSMSSVAAGMAETSSNLSTVAAAAEEMTATINEVSTNTAKARQTTDEAVTQTREAKARVEHLNKAAAAIDKVTETITDISEQTNLLALNATIEAARAGEAGKGFSIVASEIKDLAGQTAKATEEIKKEIQQIQDETADTVSLITKVDSIIFNINELTESIATAIEEQSATTREISSNINQASDAGHEISGNITQSSTVTRQLASDVSDISTMSDSISENSSKASSSADELAQIASTLREMASNFKV